MTNIISAPQSDSVSSANPPPVPQSDEGTPCSEAEQNIENGLKQIEEQISTNSSRTIQHLKIPTVAFLGPDGSGKSTLINNIHSRFEIPVRTFYMGLYQNPKRKHLPLRIPGLRLFFNILKQWRICLFGLYHQRQGRLVIFDRYTYDSLLPSAKPMNFYRQIRQWLLVNSCPAPDMVILLDAPGQTLFDRKGEHTAEHLEELRQAYRQLQDRLPQLIVLNASQDLEDVYQEATTAIWNKIDAMNREVTHA